MNLFIMLFVSLTTLNGFLYGQSNVVKRNEKLSTEQINYLKNWGITIPGEKNCINKYIKTSKGWELKNTYVLYNNSDDERINSEYGEFRVLFYEKNSYLFIISSDGNVLSTTKNLIDLKNNIKQLIYWSLIRGEYKPTVNYYNILDTKIELNKIDKSIIEKFNYMTKSEDVIFKDFN